jgi:membrane-bound metal-dependent hydrolase YbcI (DUF457 family)
MLKPSHVNIWATVALSSILLTGWYFSIFLLFYRFLSELDDADHDKSKITNSLWLKLPGAKHRGYSHTLLFNILVALWIYFWVKYFYPTLNEYDLYVLLRISLSHLLADILTVRWVPLLWPLTNKNFWLFLMTTGKFWEKLFTLLMAFVNLWLIFMIIVKYIIPKTYTIWTYNINLIILAIISQWFIVYLLFKEEIFSLKSDVMQVIKWTFKMILNIIINWAVVYWLFYLNQTFNFINLNAIAHTYNIAGNTLIWIIWFLCFFPSISYTLKQIDKLSFQFASAVNISLMSMLIIFFWMRLI